MLGKRMLRQHEPSLLLGSQVLRQIGQALEALEEAIDQRGLLCLRGNSDEACPIAERGAVVVVVVEDPEWTADRAERQALDAGEGRAASRHVAHGLQSGRKL